MKMVFAIGAALLAAQSTAAALDLNQVPWAMRKGDRCRADVGYFRAMGLVTASGRNHLMCYVNGPLGAQCHCMFGQYRVAGQIVRNADYADTKD
jgi:hypothetical protein